MGTKTYYRICPDCGCHLDPGEKCDCQDSNQIEARVAAAQGVTSLHTVTTRKDKVLMYHDIIKRLSDGKIFQVTSDGDDSATPDSASLNMRQCTCEEWTIPK